jgi:hypothetical protein
MESISVSTIADFITQYIGIIDEWDTELKSMVWFRGIKKKIEKGKKKNEEVEEDEDEDEKEKREKGYLLPKAYLDKLSPDKENEKYQFFRSRSPAFGDMPEFSRIDLWYFIMRHYEVPTRLLDWSESALVAAYFALNELKFSGKPKQQEAIPIIWIMSPYALNEVTYKESIEKKSVPELTQSLKNYHLPWSGYLYGLGGIADKLGMSKEDKQHYSACQIENIRAAFEARESRRSYPEALFPNYTMPRMSAQKSCFTVHGSRRLGIDRLFDLDDFVQYKKYLRWIEFRFDNEEQYKKVMFELKTLGYTQTTVFPDLDNLGKEINNKKVPLY